MDVEIEQKDIKIKILENKIGLPDSKIIEKINQDYENYHPKEKVMSLWKYQRILLIITNTLKTKKQ